MATVSKQIVRRPALLISVVLAMALLALAWATRPWQRQLLVGYWRAEIETLEDAQVLPALEHLASRQPPESGLLAELAGHRRASIARAAQEVIWNLLDRWDRLPLDESTQWYGEMAAAMAGQVDAYGPAARRFAGDCIGRILDRPIAPSGEQESELRQHCATILQHVPASSLQVVQANNNRQYDPSTYDAPPPVPRDVSADILEMAALPGGGLPYKPLGVRRVPLGHLPKSESPQALPEQPQRLPEAPADSSPARIPQRLEPHHQARPIDPPKRSTGTSNSSVNLSLADPLEVIGMLHAGDLGRRQAAERELQRQGFSPSQLQLALHLGHPEEKVRLTLVETLTRLPRVDARRWLKWLCRDEAASVRHAALSVLATSPDPATVQFVRDTARQDVDTRILKLAEQLSRPRK